MLIGGYEIPRRLLALLGVLALVVVVAVVLLVVKPFSKGNSSAASHNAPTAVNTPVSGKKVKAIKGAKFIVSLKGPSTLLGGKYSVFATLTKDNQTVWTQRLTAKPVGSALPSGNYVLSVAFSPCKIKGQKQADCNVFHGGVGIPPQPIVGGKTVKVTVTPACRKVSFGVGIDCSKTKVVTG